MLKDVTFGDGATATGYFTVDTGGFLTSFDIQTSASATAAAETYSAGASPSITSDKTGVSFFIDAYQISLDLTFTAPLTTGSTDNALKFGGASYEAQDSYAQPNLDVTRDVTAGYAAAPEPTAWTLILVGVGAVGGALRRRLKAIAA